jgi:hypothetical protein
VQCHMPHISADKPTSACVYPLISSDEEVSNRLIVMAQEYKARADVTEAESKSPPAATVIQSVSPDRKTDEC